MLHLLSDALNLIFANQEQGRRIKVLEGRAREASEKAYEIARYPHQIDGYLDGEPVRYEEVL